jgi:hypothetical protein
MIDLVLPLKILAYFSVEDIEVKNFDNNDIVINDIKYDIPNLIKSIDYIGYNEDFLNLNSYDLKVITSILLKKNDYFLINKNLFIENYT